MKLHLGVADEAYGAKRGRKATTGDVAEILEDRYGVMETFYQTHAAEVADEIEATLARRLNGTMPGRREARLPHLEGSFRDFLSRQQMDGRVAGVPTAAARRVPRPSFIDTGKYRQAFRAWIED